MNAWSTQQIPNLNGKSAVVTGADGGLGRETTRGLARAGARVVMACLDPADGEAAAAAIRQDTPQADLHVRAIDLGDLASVHRFAENIETSGKPIDILINNAGVMAVPEKHTADGFEMQMGINHLGHFALTGLLLPQLRTAATARVVTISSFSYIAGRVCLEDLHFRQRRYRKWQAYAQSKLANLLFALELHHRLVAHEGSIISVAAHPGYAATPLLTASPEMSGSRFWSRFMNTGNRLVAQTPTAGALPALYAATMPDVRSGDFFGPDGLTKLRGHPARTQPTRRGRDRVIAEQLWRLSEQETAISFPW